MSSRTARRCAACPSDSCCWRTAARGMRRVTGCRAAPASSPAARCASGRGGLPEFTAGTSGKSRRPWKRTRAFNAFPPACSSWLNELELCFGKIQRNVIVRGIFTSAAAPTKKLMRCIRQDNEAPRTVKSKYADPTRRIGAESAFACGSCEPNDLYHSVARVHNTETAPEPICVLGGAGRRLRAQCSAKARALSLSMYSRANFSAVSGSGGTPPCSLDD